MAAAAAEIDKVADEADDLYKWVREQVTMHNGCWGTTTTGKQFEQDYIPKRDGFITHMHTASGGLSELGDETRARTNRLTAAEQSAEQISHSLRAT